MLLFSDMLVTPSGPLCVRCLMLTLSGPVALFYCRLDLGGGECYFGCLQLRCRFHILPFGMLCLSAWRMMFVKMVFALCISGGG